MISACGVTLERDDDAEIEVKSRCEPVVERLDHAVDVREFGFVGADIAANRPMARASSWWTTRSIPARLDDLGGDQAR